MFSSLESYPMVVVGDNYDLGARRFRIFCSLVPSSENFWARDKLGPAGNPDVWYMINGRLHLFMACKPANRFLDGHGSGFGDANLQGHVPELLEAGDSKWDRWFTSACLESGSGSGCVSLNNFTRPRFNTGGCLLQALSGCDFPPGTHFNGAIVVKSGPNRQMEGGKSPPKAPDAKKADAPDDAAHATARPKKRFALCLFGSVSKWAKSGESIITKSKSDEYVSLIPSQRAYARHLFDETVAAAVEGRSKGQGNETQPGSVDVFIHTWVPNKSLQSQLRELYKPLAFSAEDNDAWATTERRRRGFREEQLKYRSMWASAAKAVSLALGHVDKSRQRGVLP